MGEKKVKRQISKEFQIKLVQQKRYSDVDYQKAALKALEVAIYKVFGNKAVFDGGKGSWKRRGTRFDTSGQGFKARNLTLAIEAANSRNETKVKCKYHNFIPELLFEKMKEAISWPTRKKFKGKSIKRKMKLEEDVHFDNIKFCASGSVVLLGTTHNFKKVKDFGKFFKRINRWIPGKTHLGVISDWKEVLKNDMRIKKKGSPFKDDLEFYLCNRWNRSDGSLDESELSFKIKAVKITKKGRAIWDHKELKAANKLYLELQRNPVFIQAPSIFFVDTPASSTSIKKVCQMSR